MQIQAFVAPLQNFPVGVRAVGLIPATRRQGRGLFARTAFVLAMALGLTSGILSAQTPVITQYTGVSGAAGIAVGQDAALWFTERDRGKIGRISLAGAIAEVALPNPQAGPWSITSGPDEALWFTEFYANKIGRITLGRVITEYPIPTARACPRGITTGPDGALWFVETCGDKIGRITTTGDISEFPVPTADSGPDSIAVGPDGALWFTESDANGNKIGRSTMV